MPPADAARFRQKRLEQGLSPNIVNHDISYLRAVFNYAIHMDEWRHDNPFAKLKALQLPEREPAFLTQEQIEALGVRGRSASSASIAAISAPSWATRFTRVDTGQAVSAPASRWCTAERMASRSINVGSSQASRLSSSSTRGMQSWISRSMPRAGSVMITQQADSSA